MIPKNHSVLNHFGLTETWLKPDDYITLNESIPPPRLLLSPIHTARWSWKIARKLPECLLCERKHVPGLIPGLIPGWDPSNIAGFSPGTSAV